MYNGTTVLGSFLFKHGKYGFNANELAVQYISIPIGETPFVDVSYTKATLFFYHGLTTIPGYWLDDVKFLNSLPTIIYADQQQSDWNELDQNKVTYIKGRFDQTLKEDKANKGIANGYAPLNSATKIAATYLDIVNDLVTGGIASLLSAEQGTVIKSQIDAIYILLASDNINLDTVQEIVDAIETVQLSLSTILVNDLTTGGVTKALTAEQGKVLKGLIDAIQPALKTRITNATVTGTYTLNHALGNDWKLTLTGVTVIDESNLPTGTDTIEFTMKVTGNFGLTVPAYWTILGDTYDGTIWNFFAVQIHKGDATQEATCFISNF